MTVQNEETVLEDVQPVIDENIANTVHEIFSAVLELNPLQTLFEDLAKRLIDDLAANSLLDYNLELKEDQKKQLTSACRNKGHEVVSLYLSNLNVDERTKKVYGVCREKTTEIVDAILSSIGREINRGALINAWAVQANSKNPKYDEILLRKTKSAGDITVPTSVVMISTNCVEIIKASCQEAKKEDAGEESEPGEDTEETAEKNQQEKGGEKSNESPGRLSRASDFQTSFSTY
jgi:hypothetical protein